MILSRYGLREWGLATAAAIAILILTAPSLAATIPVVIIWAAIAAFFRDPLFRRAASRDPADLVSPADGVVSAVFTCDHHEATQGPATVVRIFLSVLDVHINRMPCAATVLSIKHTPGQYLDARKPQSAQVNECNLVVVRNGDGDSIGIRQISGAIARRIVCPIQTGETFARAERFGMIKFGSTTELIIPRPVDTTVRVAKGDRVVGGVTTLARLARSTITATSQAPHAATAALRV